MLEIAVLGHAVRGGEQHAADWTEHRTAARPAPHVELALLALAVGVELDEESPLAVAEHLAQERDGLGVSPAGVARTAVIATAGLDVDASSCALS